MRLCRKGLHDLDAPGARTKPEKSHPNGRCVECRRVSHRRYAATDKRRAVVRRYSATGKGRATVRRYSATDKGRATVRRSHAICAELRRYDPLTHELHLLRQARYDAEHREEIRAAKRARHASQRDAARAAFPGLSIDAATTMLRAEQGLPSGRVCSTPFPEFNPWNPKTKREARLAAAMLSPLKGAV